MSTPTTPMPAGGPAPHEPITSQPSTPYGLDPHQATPPEPVTTWASAVDPGTLNEPPAPAAAGVDPQKPAVIRGPNWPAIIVGLACVIVGATAIWQTVNGQWVDWERYGPFLLGAVGLLMVAAGAIGMIRRSRTSPES